MSYDVHFVRPDMRDRWSDALEQFEQAAAVGLEWNAGLDAEWKEIESSALDEVPGLTSSKRRLHHTRTFVELAGHPEQISLTVPYSSGPAKETVTVLAALALIVQTQAELIAYDPQSGGAFLEDSGDMSSASRLRLESLLTPSDCVGGTSGIYAFLSKGEVKKLRSIRGDASRRRHTAQLLKTLPSERLLIVGPEWNYLYALGRENKSIEELGLFSGQSMHKGTGNSIVLLKDLETKFERMSATCPDDVRSRVRAFSDETLWWYLSFLDSGTAKMTDELSDRVGNMWEDVHTSFGHAVNHDLEAIFVCDHRRRAAPAAGITMIVEKPSPPKATPIVHEPLVLRPHPMPDSLPALLRNKQPSSFTAYELYLKAEYRRSRSQPLEAAILFEAAAEQAEVEFATVQNPKFDNDGRHINSALIYWARAGVHYAAADRLDLAHPLLDHARNSDWISVGLTGDMFYMATVHKVRS